MSSNGSINGLEWAQSRVHKKGAQAGRREFQKLLALCPPSSRLVVYQEWEKACSESHKTAVHRKALTEAAELAAELRRVQLEASKEFPEVWDCDKSGSKDEGASTSGQCHEAHALTDKTHVQPLQTYENAIAVRSARDKVKIVSGGQLQVAPCTNGEFNKAGDLAEARAGGLQSELLSEHKAGAAAPYDPANKFRVREGGGNPKGFVRPGAKSAQVVQETEQKLVPDTDNAGYNLPERQGNLKRALLSTYPAAVDAADSRTGDVGKRLKDTHNKTHGEQDWLDNGSKSVSVTHSRHDTVHSVCCDRKGINTVTSVIAEGAIARLCSGPQQTSTPLRQQPLVPAAVKSLSPVQNRFEPAPTKMNQAVRGNDHQRSDQPPATTHAVQHSLSKEQPASSQQAFRDTMPGDAAEVPHGGGGLHRGAATASPTQTEHPGTAVNPQSAMPAKLPSQSSASQLTSKHLRAPKTQGGVERLFETPEFVIVKGVKYKKIALLGKGGSSKVFRVMAPNDKQFALKRVSMTNMSKESRQQYREEVEMLRRLHWSEAVVTMHHFQEFKKEQVLFVVLECGECDVKGLLESKKLTDVVHNDGTTSPRSRGDPFAEHPNFICCLWQDMLRVVQAVHDARIVHSDLKPANFLCVKGRLKLIDFGIARPCGNNTTAVGEQDQGTMNFMSPEVLQGERIGRASDVWSLGCILYQISYGRLPFEHLTNFVQKAHAITNVLIDFKPLSRSDVLDVIKRCLVRDPAKRATIAELLEHEYVKAAAGGQLTVKVMREMHSAIVKAQPQSLEDHDSERLFNELQSHRNQGNTKITAATIVQQYLQRHPRCAPQVPHEPAPTYQGSVSTVKPPTFADDAPAGSLTAGTGSATVKGSAGLKLGQPGHQAGRVPLAVIASSASAEHSTERGGAAGEVAAHAVCNSDPPGVVRSLGAVKPRAVYQQGASVCPGDALDARLKSIHDAHASGDEGMRMSIRPT